VVQTRNKYLKLNRKRNTIIVIAGQTKNRRGNYSPSKFIMLLLTEKVKIRRVRKRILIIFDELNN
jgi:hypothetical protein